MKHLKDYLHLYFGCECLYNNKTTIYSIQAFDKWSEICDLRNVSLGGNFSNQVGIENIKLILRPLNDMTEEEMLEYGKNVDSLKDCDNAEFSRAGAIVFSTNGFPNGHMYPDDYNTAESFRYLLSKGFDLFNLINDGLAIDKTKV